MPEPVAAVKCSPERLPPASLSPSPAGIQQDSGRRGRRVNASLRPSTNSGLIGHRRRSPHPTGSTAVSCTAAALSPFPDLHPFCQSCTLSCQNRGTHHSPQGSTLMSPRRSPEWRSPPRRDTPLSPQWKRWWQCTFARPPRDGAQSLRSRPMPAELPQPLSAAPSPPLDKLLFSSSASRPREPPARQASQRPAQPQHLQRRQGGRPRSRSSGRRPPPPRGPRSRVVLKPEQGKPS
ncbi:uncharacterized protein LOC143707197 [Siphateles boraxobius]|uniref:uncharacterized protein LOC143707197 n=1 Tax=Siphateles boraxobius TaxID=180520 RepID=UPI0040632771